MTHTKDRLAAALLEAGLKEMATRAGNAWYDDYLSPLDTPIMTLVDDLAVAAAKADVHARPAVLELRRRAMNGDFDATLEESEAWAASPEGQETMRSLLRNQPLKGTPR